MLKLTQAPLLVPSDFNEHSITEWILYTNFGFGKRKEFSKGCQHPQQLIVFQTLTCLSGVLTRVSDMLTILQENAGAIPASKIIDFQTTFMADYLPSREVLLSVLNKIKSSSSVLMQHRIWKVFQQYQLTFQGTLSPLRFEISRGGPEDFAAVFPLQPTRVVRQRRVRERTLRAHGGERQLGLRPLPHGSADVFCRRHVDLEFDRI